MAWFRPFGLKIHVVGSRLELFLSQAPLGDFVCSTGFPHPVVGRFGLLAADTLSELRGFRRSPGSLAAFGFGCIRQCLVVLGVRPGSFI